MEKNDFFKLMDVAGINQDLLLDLAFEADLIKRRRLITPSDILYSICMESTSGTVSYNDLAAKIESKCGVCVSRQAVWKKVTNPCKDFFEKVLELIILTKVNKAEVGMLRRSSHFKRILVQDSTIIRLPVSLFKIFSGVANAHSKVCNARIQGVVSTFQNIERVELLLFKLDGVVEKCKSCPGRDLFIKQRAVKIDMAKSIGVGHNKLCCKCNGGRSLQHRTHHTFYTLFLAVLNDLYSLGYTAALH